MRVRAMRLDYIHNNKDENYSLDKDVFITNIHRKRYDFILQGREFLEFIESIDSFNDIDELIIKGKLPICLCH